MLKSKVKKLKSVEAAYIAALIDGEGSIMLTRAHKDEYRRVNVSISNCDKKMLEWVLKIAGIGKIFSKKIYNREHTPTFTYRITCKETLPFLKQILPYLHTYKKERAKIILKDFTRLTPRNGKYSKKMLAEKIKFTKKFFSISPSKRNRLLNFI